jgi:hypothetical protein
LKNQQVKKEKKFLFLKIKIIEKHALRKKKHAQTFFLFLQLINSNFMFTLFLSGRVIIVVVTVGVICLVSLILCFLEEFGSELTSSVELDVLTRRIKEAKTLGVGEVQAPDDEGEDEKDKNDEEIQPPEIGVDFLDASLNSGGGHFFGRGLTAGGAGPAAEIGRNISTTRLGVRVVCALSSAAVGSSFAVQRNEEVALSIVVAGVRVGGQSSARRHGALVADDQASGVEEASGIVGRSDGDVRGAADPGARSTVGRERA